MKVVVSCCKIAVTLEQPTKLVSAGINRHGVTNERVVKKRIANHLPFGLIGEPRKTWPWWNREPTSEPKGGDRLKQTRSRSNPSIDPRDRGFE
jgi:hypothetical protein